VVQMKIKILIHALVLVPLIHVVMIVRFETLPIVNVNVQIRVVQMKIKILSHALVLVTLIYVMIQIRL
jgi:hypothetical protein